MHSHLKESSYERAWRIIRAMQTDIVSNDNFIIVRLCCYLQPSLIAQNIEKYGYGHSASQIKKFKKPFPFNLLPIPSPYYFYLIDTELSQIFDLALSCNEYLMFEILITDRINTNRIRQICNSRNNLYTDSLELGLLCKRYFFCGFDFDDTNYESGVSQASHYNFVPDFLSLYFPR